jgi:hypothetical protein
VAVWGRFPGRSKADFGYCFLAGSAVRDISHASLGAIMNLATRLFLLPGNLIANLLDATKADDRMMIRTLINMLFWNVIIVVGALVIYL